MAGGSILVIKLGALGDFVQALGPFAAIRRHHAQARIVLLTTRAYAEFAASLGLFDEVWTDSRPKAAQIGEWLNLRHRLRGGGFVRVYDLQTSDRSSFYYRLFWPGPYPEWSGIARGCSHPHVNPRRDTMHTVERQAEQLALAGIPETPPPDLSSIRAETGRFELDEAFALLVPGGSPHRPAKRWPSGHYAELGNRLAGRGIEPVLLGGAAEADDLEAIEALCPKAVNLAGLTTFQDIVALARQARLAVGNDTGPMHLIALSGCPSLVLYSAASDPALCSQRGPRVTLLRRDDLADLGVDEVEAAMNPIL
ncbi:MAG: glycosyltransferase family 9 protein [Magnetospirillum sp. WYHS-4]